MGITFGIRVYSAILCFVAGTVSGSFINCLACRTVHGESVLRGRSHCALCGHVLGAGDLVPIISYIVLRGKCRYCGGKVSLRYPATEIIAGTAFVVSFAGFSLGFQMIRLDVLFCILFVLSLIDLEIYEIPDRFVAYGIMWWALTSPFSDCGMDILGFIKEEGHISLSVWISNCLAGLLGGFVIAAGMLAISLIFDRVLGKESLGGGDIKLFFMTGLYLGLLPGLFSLVLSCFFGLLIALAMKKEKVPYAPAIAAAAFFSIIFSNRFLEWYMSLII